MTCSHITTSMDAGIYTWYITPTNNPQLAQTRTDALLHIICTKPTRKSPPLLMLVPIYDISLSQTPHKLHEHELTRYFPTTYNSHETKSWLVRKSQLLWMLVSIHDISLPRTTHNSHAHELTCYVATAYDFCEFASWFPRKAPPLSLMLVSTYDSHSPPITRTNWHMPYELHMALTDHPMTLTNYRELAPHDPLQLTNDSFHVNTTLYN